MALAEIIKYEGDNSTFVWKHPCEDFHTGSQLIVHESQEAILFLNGQALDLFGPGRHTLETQNIPHLGKLLNRTTGGETPFHCEVYFINRTVQMAIKWGTPDKVRFIDPLTSVPLEIGASGELNLQVSDSRKLLVKLVGTMKGIAWEDRSEGFTKSISASFRPLITSAVKVSLPSVIHESKIDLLEIDTKLDVLSKQLHQKILPDFEEYGLTIPQFYITTVVLPDQDPNFKRIRDLHTVLLQTQMMQAEATLKTVHARSEAAYRTAEEESKAAIEAARRQAELERQITETEIARREAERTVIAAQADAQATQLAGMAEAEVMRAKGYSQKDVLQADVQKAYAEGLGNMGANGGGGALGDIAGLGVTLGAIGGMMDLTKKACSPMFENTEQPAKRPGTELCRNCGAPLSSGAVFCDECGAPVQSKTDFGFCDNCGFQFEKPGKFCPKCGTKREG